MEAALEEDKDVFSSSIIDLADGRAEVVAESLLTATVSLALETTTTNNNNNTATCNGEYLECLQTGLSFIWIKW